MSDTSNFHVPTVCIGPEDTLIVFVPERFPPKAREMLKQVFTERFPHLVGRVLVLDETLTLSVLRADAL